MRIPILTLAALTLLAIGAAAKADMSDADEEALYQKRFQQMQSGNTAAYYDPMETIVGASSAEALPTAPPSIDAAALAKAGDYAARNNSTAFLVWRHGVLQYARYFGETNPATLINSLSLAKPLAVIAVGRALELGKIRSLDQPVADYIQEWRGTPKAAITIRELLQMRSGLLAQAISPDPANPLNRAYLHPDHGRILVADYPLTDPPGSKYAYSNANAELVAILIERATGRRYAAFLSDAVLKPLHAAGGKLWIDRPNGLAHSGCCVQLPAETWLRLGILFLQQGVWNGHRLLSTDFMAAMTTPTDQNPYAAGMGIYVAGPYTARRGFSGPGQPGPQVLHGEPYLAADLMLFDGNADQVVYIVPSADLVALRVGGFPPKTPEWDNSVIPNLLLAGIDWRGRPPAPQLKR